MIKFNNKNECCGCTGCYSICPVKCISMERDSEGFYYPKVNTDRCISCNACTRVCPMLHSDHRNRIQRAFIVQSKNHVILSESTSGGFVSSVIEWVLENGGIACASSYTQNMDVAHVIVSDRDKLELWGNRIRGSKYVQSYLGDSFQEVKKYLEENRLALFIGTPCQVYGLKNYIGKNDNLITIDLVCHGVPSPLLWESYVKYQERRYHSRISSVNFRDKGYGYFGSVMKITFSNNKVYKAGLRRDYMLKCFYGDISSRPSCYSCPFKGIERSGDFTIFDSWHANEMVKDTRVDGKMGFTNLLINSEKGDHIWESLKKAYTYYPVDAEEAIRFDGIMITSTPTPHVNREKFYPMLLNVGLEKTVKKLIPITVADQLRDRARCIVMKYKSGRFE